MEPNDFLLTTRVPHELAAHSRAIANEQGMTLSAFTRQALHRNVRTYVDHERELIGKRMVR